VCPSCVISCTVSPFSYFGKEAPAKCKDGEMPSALQCTGRGKISGVLLKHHERASAVQLL
jgi:hypothetical protein